MFDYSKELKRAIPSVLKSDRNLKKFGLVGIVEAVDVVLEPYKIGSHFHKGGFPKPIPPELDYIRLMKGPLARTKKATFHFFHF